VSRSSFLSIARWVAWRNMRSVIRSPATLAPTILLPLLFMIAFAGALSRITSLPNFPDVDYTAFQYVYALLQAAAFAGAVGGTAMIDDFESGFMDRLMLAAPARAGIVAGYVVAMLLRAAIAVVILTGVALALGMDIEGGVVDMAALLALAVLLNVTATLWATGVAMHVGTVNAAPGAILPIFLALFLTPVFMPLALLSGWLHAVAKYNPFTWPIEGGRALIAGTHTDVALAFGVMGGLTVGAALWALWGVRRAEASGA
jgi:ABC-2 type transport system permease protein